MQDNQLLTQYAQNNSESAFSQIIARHLPLVYRTCRRELGSDTLAADAAQVVFLLLARKAKTLRAGPSLAGWLFQTACFVAKDVRKQEARRRRREEAVMQEAIHQQATPTLEWDTVEPLLNNALAALKPAEREAVLLRFFEGHTLAETGTLLGLSEDAARMRVTRALDKLRRYLASHGAAVTSVVLTGLLTAEAAHPVPSHAAATITQGTLQAISTGPTANVLMLSKGVSHTMKIIKIKFAAAAAVVLIAGASIPPLAHAFSPHRAGMHALTAPALRAETPTQAAETPPVSAIPAAEIQGNKTQTIVLQHTVPVRTRLP
jgi:RNA polymerase sigma factor (sigma-70 family)